MMKLNEPYVTTLRAELARQFVCGMVAVLLLSAIVACTTNPHKTVQTFEQQGDALYGEFVILKEQGARIIQDASVPDEVKRPIAEAIVDAKPITDSLQDTLILYSEAKAAVLNGTGTQERLAIVDRELADWIRQVQPVVNQLVTAISGARP